MSQFQFGAHAIFTPAAQTQFHQRRDSVLAAIRPANLLESIITEELLHAGWEMERVRDNNADTAHHARASRAWHRSLKQLKKLQSARATHQAELCEPAERKVAAQCPLADVTSLPKPLWFPTPEVQ